MAETINDAHPWPGNLRKRQQPRRHPVLQPGAGSLRGGFIDHQMYRHYDTLWSQQIVAGGGVYWQKQRSPGAITLLGYGQRVQWNNVLDTGLMLNWDKRPYDGKRESNLAVTFDATLRF